MTKRILIVVCCLGCLWSCKVKHNLQDHSQTVTKDSSSVAMLKFEDNLNLTIHNENSQRLLFDSIKLTWIYFGEGGSYNSKTGEANNVIAVSESEKVHRLESLLSVKDSTIESLSSKLDSTSVALSNLEQHNDIKEVTEVSVLEWWVWLLIGAAGMLVLIVVLKKNPYTAPFMFWL